MKSLEKSSLFDMVLGEAGARCRITENTQSGLPEMRNIESFYMLITICQISFGIADMLALLNGKRKPQKELKTKGIT